MFGRCTSDLSGEVEAEGLCLVKAAEPQYELATASTIRLSRPGVFRHMGEVLIQDNQEGRARTSTSESVDVPIKEPELVGERVSALNAALQLGRTKMSVGEGEQRSKQSNTSAAAVTFGNDYLIYCTAMRPSKEEEEAWKRAFPDIYSRFTPIYRPTQFAQGLGARRVRTYRGSWKGGTGAGDVPRIQDRGGAGARPRWCCTGRCCTWTAPTGASTRPNSAGKSSSQ